MRDDDVKALLDAVRMIRGVAHVKPHIVRGGDHFVRQQASHELKMKLHEFIQKLP